MTIVTQPEWINLETELCGFCGFPLIGSARIEGHKSCIRKGREMDALKKAKEGFIDNRQIDEREDFLKCHPDGPFVGPDGPFVGPDGLTYHKRLAKQEAEREESQRQRLIDNAERLRRKEFLEGQLRVLNLQIENDENILFGQKEDK